MGAYKKLNKQDAYITTHTAHKTWIISGSDFTSYGITTNIATGSYLSSLQQLYYPTQDGDNIVSHSYDYYNQSTLHVSSSRNLTTGSYIISIPRSLYGVNLQPDIATRLGASGFDSVLYAKYPYWVDDYVNEPVLGRIPDLAVGLDDDGEGNLYVVGISPRQIVGNIIYPHGMIIITDPEYAIALEAKPLDYIQFGSSQPIYTHNYHCRIRESEFNFTYNPSILSGSLKTTYDNEGVLYSTASSVSNGVISSKLTGSAFQPYITTVGLYNDANELIAVGKMSQPVPKPANTEMTIIVKIDI